MCPADALVRAGMPCRVLAIINDSVGCLAASCYHDQATEMGVILGTGTNACIVVPVSGCYLHDWVASLQPAGFTSVAATRCRSHSCTLRHTLPACSAAQVSRVPKWQPKGISPDTRTAINTEWGCYGSSFLPRVKEDLELDAASGPQQGARCQSRAWASWQLLGAVCLQGWTRGGQQLRHLWRLLTAPTTCLDLLLHACRPHAG